MNFFNLVLFFTTSTLQSVTRCSRKCLHTLDTVSKPMLHKCVIQLTSISISWCFPGQSSFRLVKPYAVDGTSISLTEINEHFDLSYFSFPVHVDQQCFDTIYLQSQCSSLPLWWCLSDFFHPLTIHFFHLVTLTQMLACTPALTKYLL